MDARPAGWRRLCGTGQARQPTQNRTAPSRRCARGEGGGRRLAAEGRLEWVQRPFQLSDLDGNYLVIAATNSAAVNSAVYQGAVERGILCNSVDDIPIAISSSVRWLAAASFKSPYPQPARALPSHSAYAGKSTSSCPRIWPWLENLGRLRREVLAAHPRTEARRLLLHQLAQRPVCESASCPSRQIALAPIDKQNANSRGKVHLVGAGPAIRTCSPSRHCASSRAPTSFSTTILSECNSRPGPVRL